jgi:hypothetical protein
MSRGQVEEYLGLAAGSLGRIKLPEPDVVVGPLNPDGSIPRGTVRGWLRETIDAWNTARPGRGARTDLKARSAVESATSESEGGAAQFPQAFGPDAEASDIDLDKEEFYYRGERLTEERARELGEQAEREGAPSECSHTEL